MKRLNKKGFTLIELLAVIVLLAILAIAGGTAIGRMLNQSKRTNFVTAYNNVRKEMENQIALKGEPISSVVTGGIASNVAKDYDLSETDYTLNILSKTDSGTAYYEIKLVGSGTYKNIKLTKSACDKAKGQTDRGFNCDQVNTPPSITGYMTAEEDLF